MYRDSETQLYYPSQFQYRKGIMKPTARLRLCNRWLGCTLIIMLASGIQLEATSGKFIWSVWIHIITGIALTVFSFYHIFLHYRLANWFLRFAKNRNTATRILWWTFLLTTISGIAATAIWLAGYNHSHLGAIHGKFGFLMIAVSIVHIVRHAGLRISKATKTPSRKTL